MTTAAVLICALLGGLGILQVLMAAGAPLGDLAWGGQSRVLPPRLRVASVVSTCLYVLFASLVLDRAGILSLLPPSVSHVTIWVIAAFFALGALPNLLSRSTPERYVMAPLALLLAGLSAVVALG